MIPDYIAFAAPADTTMVGPFQEMVNSSRAYHYAQNAGIPWLLDCGYCAAANPGLVYGREPMEAPYAPWYTGHPDTRKFLGVIGLDVEGADDSTRTVNVTQTLSLGGVIGPPYYGPRTITVRALAIATDEAGLSYGMRWMHYPFADDFDPCSGDNLVFYDCCFPSSQSAYLRQFRDSRLTEGPEFLEVRRTMNSSIGAYAEVELTYVAADPTKYGPSGVPALLEAGEAVA